MTASFLKSPELFSVFWPIKTMWFWLILWFLTIPVPLLCHWGSLQVYQLQLSPSLSCSIDDFVLWQDLRACLSYHFLWFSLWSTETAKSISRPILSFLLFFCKRLLGFVFWSEFSDMLISLNPRELYASYFPERILVCAYTICSNVQIWISCTIPSGLSSPHSCV